MKIIPYSKEWLENSAFQYLLTKFAAQKRKNYLSNIKKWLKH